MKIAQRVTDYLQFGERKKYKISECIDAEFEEQVDFRQRKEAFHWKKMRKT